MRIKSNKRMALIIILSLVLFYLSCSYNIGKAEELIQASAAIHISSTISDGKYSIPEISQIARLNNIKVVIFTDRDLMRWEYGIWPLRNIIKKTVESSSVFKYGISRYLNEIRKAQERNPDLVLISGVESAPFYYWQGSPFDNSLKMYNWHKHILVIGLEKAADYRDLPVIGNREALRIPFRLKDAYRLWPILILLTGIICLRKRQFRYKDLRGRHLSPYSRPWRICGVALIIFGLLFFWNNFPYCELKYDKYKGDSGIKPYQNFIDYVNQRGGLTFWAHPEAENIQRIGRIDLETREHTVDLLEAKNYTGFSIFYEGYKKVGLPGGTWDEVLKQYCQGIKAGPIWAIAGLSFDQSGELTSRMKALRTVLLIPKLGKEEVLQALREGRMYVMRGENCSQFILDKFIIGDISTGSEATIGEEILLKYNPRIDISGYFLDRQNKPIRIKLIRNGKIVKAFQVYSPFNVSYQDDYDGGGKRFYYRLEIQSQGLLLVTNPIFVVKKV